MKNISYFLAVFLYGCTTIRVTEFPKMLVIAQNDKLEIEAYEGCIDSGGLLYKIDNCIAAACPKSACAEQYVSQIVQGNSPEFKILLDGNKSVINFEISVSIDSMNTDMLINGKGAVELKEKIEKLSPGQYFISVRSRSNSEDLTYVFKLVIKP